MENQICMSESNTQPTNYQPNDEIDIFEFCSRIWLALKNLIICIKDFVGSIIIFLIRKSLWIIFFALFGAILGYLLYGISKPYYMSYLEGNTGGIYDETEKKYSGGVDNSIVIDHINKLNQLTGKSSFLASYLNITEDEAKTIHSIKAYYGIDINKDKKPDYVDINEIYNPKDTNQFRVPSFVQIRVTVYDEDILPVLRKGLFYYINNNAYIQELFKVDRRQKRQLIKEIESEIAKIDSLQRYRYRKEVTHDKGQLVIMGNEPDIKLFYPDMLKLYAKKQLLEKNLEISDEIIVVVQDFTPLKQEEKPILHYILRYSIIMAVVGLLCALLWQYRKKIWKLINEPQSKQIETT